MQKSDSQKLASSWLLVAGPIVAALVLSFLAGMQYGQHHSKRDSIKTIAVTTSNASSTQPAVVLVIDGSTGKVINRIFTIDEFRR